MDANEVAVRLRTLARPDALAGMARYGIATQHALGVSMPCLRRMGREIGRNHALAGDLWRSGIHDARILASLVDDPEEVTDEQMEAWALDFDSWDLCDQCVMNLFARVPTAVVTAITWSQRKEEFVKRAGFVIMARLASSSHSLSDEEFEPYLEAIQRESRDPRNYVKKGVSWALRAIGARNQRLNARALDVATRLSQESDATARWIGRDALKELTARAAAGRYRHTGLPRRRLRTVP